MNSSKLRLHAVEGLEQPEIFVLRVAIRHSGEIIANRLLQAALPCPKLVTLRQLFGGLAELREECFQAPPALGRHPNHAVMRIDFLMQKIFEILLESGYVAAGLNEKVAGRADIGHRGNAGGAQAPAGLLEQIAYLPVDQGADRSGLELQRADLGVFLTDAFNGPPPELDAL